MLSVTGMYCSSKLITVANILPRACRITFDYDDEVEGIDTQELYDNPQRLEMIARYIVDTP